MVKKNNAIQSRLGRNIQALESLENGMTIDELKKFSKQSKQKRIANKKIAEQLGNKKIASIHLDKYSNEFKNLIGKLNDANLDAVQMTGQTVQVKEALININENDSLIFDSEDDEKAGKNNHLKEILQ